VKEVIMFSLQGASVEQAGCKPPDFGFLAQALAAGATVELVERLADKYLTAYAEYCARSGSGQFATGGAEGLEIGSGESVESSMLSVSVGSSVSAVVESGRCYTWLTVSKRSKALRRQLGLWPTLRQVLSAPAKLYDLERIRKCVLVRQGPGLYHVERQGSDLYVWQVFVELAGKHPFPDGSLGSALASERAPRPIHDLSLSSKIGGKVSQVTREVEDPGFCYLQLVLPRFRSIVAQELGPDPTFLTLLDSSVQWFDYGKFDQYSIHGSKDLAHLVLGEGNLARLVFGQLARECHPISGTLAAVAVSWLPRGEVLFDFDTQLGGLPVAQSELVQSLEAVEDGGQVRVFLPEGKTVLVRFEDGMVFDRPTYMSDCCVVGFSSTVDSFCITADVQGKGGTFECGIRDGKKLNAWSIGTGASMGDVQRLIAHADLGAFGVDAIVFMSQGLESVCLRDDEACSVLGGALVVVDATTRESSSVQLSAVSMGDDMLIRGRVGDLSRSFDELTKRRVCSPG
jgi:hypothetical protein